MWECSARLTFTEAWQKVLFSDVVKGWTVCLCPSLGLGSPTHHLCWQRQDLVLQSGSTATLWVRRLPRRREIKSYSSCWPSYKNLSGCGESNSKDSCLGYNLLYKVSVCKIFKQMEIFVISYFSNYESFYRLVLQKTLLHRANYWIV